MGYIKEPAGVDFVVDPTPLTKGERERISEIIAHYKATGRKLPANSHSSREKRSTTKTGITRTAKKKVLE